MLSCVIKDFASLVAPLVNLTDCRQSSYIILCSKNLLTSFNRAQKALSSNQSIVILKSEDQLWIVIGSVKMNGLSTTLYVCRESNLILGGFFSANMRQDQVTWLPCEVETLFIASAIKHFSPYIIQSYSPRCVLTDGKLCVQSFEKLCPGQFSPSHSITIFLSTVSRYQISVRHLAASFNLPSDYASRNVPPCDDPQGQICSFIPQAEDSVVHPISA